MGIAAHGCRKTSILGGLYTFCPKDQRDLKSSQKRCPNFLLLFQKCCTPLSHLLLRLYREIEINLLKCGVALLECFDYAPYYSTYANSILSCTMQSMFRKTKQKEYIWQIVFISIHLITWNICDTHAWTVLL